MKLLSLVLFLALALPAIGDGTVTVPANIAPASWGISEIRITAGIGGDTAGARIAIYYFDAGANIVRTDVVLLTAVEIVSLITTMNSPVAGESGTQVKRFRQRVTKWLIDNGKISNVTPE